MPNPAARALLWCLFLSPLAGPTSAQQSNAARYLMNEQIAAACDGAGRIDPSGFIERDLTGDGQDDLIIAHEAITCGTGRRSAFCGMQVCSVLIYVREDGLLKLKTDMLGGGVTVGAGDRPAISMYAHGGARGEMRWNGTAFR